MTPPRANAGAARKDSRFFADFGGNITRKGWAAATPVQGWVDSALPYHCTWRSFARLNPLKINALRRILMAIDEKPSLL
jgi:hypothetical protein